MGVYTEQPSISCADIASPWLQSLVCGLSPAQRSEKLFMMLQGYFDDSGSDQKGPYYILAGYMSTCMRWDGFTEKWQQKLVGPPKLRYFKMREAERLHDQFRGWAAPARDVFVVDLAKIIKATARVQVISHLTQADYDAVMKGRVDPLVDNPYFACFAGVLKAADDLESIVNEKISRIDYVFDLQGNLSRLASAMFRDLAKELNSDHMMGGVTWQDDEYVLPLQAADLGAWHIRRQNTFVAEPLREAFKIIDSIPTVRTHVTRKSLKVIADGMKNM